MSMFGRFVFQEQLCDKHEFFVLSLRIFGYSSYGSKYSDYENCFHLCAFWICILMRGASGPLISETPLPWGYADAVVNEHSIVIAAVVGRSQNTFLDNRENCYGYRNRNLNVLSLASMTSCSHLGKKSNNPWRHFPANVYNDCISSPQYFNKG